MKFVKSKAQERRELENQVRQFLDTGGQVEVVEPGVSGREIGSYKLTPVSFDGPKEGRTLLLDEVKAIEARKARPGNRPPHSPPKRGPRRVLITDDFGEPLRWSWQE